MTPDLMEKLRYLPEETVCPVCRSIKVKPVLDLGDVPVHCNLLWGGREEALAAPRGRLLLASCSACGHLFNAAFRPGQLRYDGAYENSLHYSPLFQDYAEGLARRLVRDYDLPGRTVVEIGCGRGDFLALLVRLGAGRGIGFDPGWEEVPLGPERKKLTFFREPFSERHSGIKADFVCCRHLLEHLGDPADLLSLLRSVLRPGTSLYVEVPHARFVLESGIWDVIYEHPSYFGERSLAELFRSAGFSVARTGPAFAGQYLQLEAVVPEGGVDPPPPCGESDFPLDEFRRRFAAGVQEWRGALARYRRGGKKAVVWGAGSKGVSFLNHIGAVGELRYAVDLNPRKHGKFLAGTGQEIVPPEFLREYRPHVVIATNPIYREEIAEKLQEMKIHAELKTL